MRTNKLKTAAVHAGITGLSGPITTVFDRILSYKVGHGAELKVVHGAELKVVHGAEL